MRVRRDSGVRERVGLVHIVLYDREIYCICVASHNELAYWRERWEQPPKAKHYSRCRMKRVKRRGRRMWGHSWLLQVDGRGQTRNNLQSYCIPTLGH